jgi:hypothetical protein
MSSNYAVLGLAMAAAGVLTDAYGARWVWTAAGIGYLLAAGVAFVMMSWMPAAVEDENVALEAVGAEAARALAPDDDDRAVRKLAPAPAPDLVPVPAPEPEPEEVDEAPTGGLERIASLLERIERRREVEARRSRR